jgi:hypothetical protein
MLSLILAALLQAGAPADPAAPPPAPTVTTVAPATAQPPMKFGIIEGKNQVKGEKVCFNDPVLGSKIPTKRCMDREEFQRRQRDTRDYVRKIQDDARAPPSN